jgi:hypothetical protein
MIIEEKAAKFLEENGVRLAPFSDGQLGFLMPVEKLKPIALVLRLLRRLRRALAARNERIDVGAMIA